jgi:hypothetical protein
MHKKEFSWKNLPKPDPNWKETLTVSLETFTDKTKKEKRKCVTQEVLKETLGKALL